MKQILIALLLAFTTSTVINAQKQSSIEKDSTENAKVTLSKKTDTKADESNTTVTVIGVDTTDMDTTAGKDDNDLPFGNLSDTISGGILISIIAIVAVFGLPVFILFVIFFFRYKNRKARWMVDMVTSGRAYPPHGAHGGGRLVPRYAPVYELGNWLQYYDPLVAENLRWLG